MTTRMTLPNESFKGSPNGATCIMIKMGCRGIKVFERRDDRDLAYSNQTQLAAVGLAPKTYFIGEIEITGATGLYRSGFNGYVYETELADCLVPYPKRADYDNEDDYQEVRAHYFEEEEPYSAAIPELKEKLESEGCMWNDAHEGNIGFIDGCAVLIDCGDDLFGSGCVISRGRRVDNIGR